jgi:ABC-type glycerol-3-phosphate transport system permease component
MSKHNTLSPMSRLTLHGLLGFMALLSLLPIVWLVAATFKTNADMFNYALLPWGRYESADVGEARHVADVGAGLSRLTLENYVELFTGKPFLRWLVNSVFLCCAQTALVVTLSSLGGFALAKYQFAGKRLLMFLMLTTMVIPGQVLLPSSYSLIRELGWLDSYWAILVPGAVSVFGMFLFMQAMHGVPDELLHCGRIDGCSELRLWWEVALPIVRPMIGAYTLLSFLGCWNSFLWPQIVLQDPARYTLPIGLTSLVGLPAESTPYGMLMAGTLLSIVPVMVLFFILQKDFIAGLTAGAVKG